MKHQKRENETNASSLLSPSLTHSTVSTRRLEVDLEVVPRSIGSRHPFSWCSLSSGSKKVQKQCAQNVLCIHSSSDFTRPTLKASDLFISMLWLTEDTSGGGGILVSEPCQSGDSSSWMDEGCSLNVWDTATERGLFVSNTDRNCWVGSERVRSERPSGTLKRDDWDRANFFFFFGDSPLLVGSFVVS